MNPDYMPSYGRWPDFAYWVDDGPSYPTPSKTYREDGKLTNKKRKARGQRRKMKRHNRRRK